MGHLEKKPGGWWILRWYRCEDIWSGTSMVRPVDHLRFSYDKDYLIDVHADHVHDDWLIDWFAALVCLDPTRHGSNDWYWAPMLWTRGRSPQASYCECSVARPWLSWCNKALEDLMINGPWWSIDVLSSKGVVTILFGLRDMTFYGRRTK